MTALLTLVKRGALVALLALGLLLSFVAARPGVTGRLADSCLGGCPQHMVQPQGEGILPPVVL